MSEMVERVAKALDKVLRENYLALNEPESWPEFIPDAARAAIEAMREPDDCMLEAAHEPYDSEGYGLSRHGAGIAYRAMIDAALITEPV